MARVAPVHVAPVHANRVGHASARAASSPSGSETDRLWPAAPDTLSVRHPTHRGQADAPRARQHTLEIHLILPGDVLEPSAH